MVLKSEIASAILDQQTGDLVKLELNIAFVESRLLSVADIKQRDEMTLALTNMKRQKEDMDTMIRTTTDMMNLYIKQEGPVSPKN